MKAAFVYGPEDVRIEETEIPELKSGEALIRIKVIGICPSDVRASQGKKEVFPYGKESRGLSGHEWAGEVTEIKDGMGRIQVGDRVVADVINACGQCKFCLMGEPNLCIHKQYNIRGFAEYVTVPEEYLLKIPDTVDLDEAFMSEPVSCCLHAFSRSKPHIGETLVVIGDGPLGIVHAQLGKAAGAKVIVSGHHAHRLKVAHQLGADLVLNSKEEDLEEAVEQFTDGYGADVVMVAVGGSGPFEEAVNVCRASGIINQFAGTYPHETVQLDPNTLHYEQLTLVGSFDSTRDRYAQALEAFAMGLVRVKPLISHRLPLEDLQKGFALLEGREGVKILIEP